MNLPLPSSDSLKARMRENTHALEEEHAERERELFLERALRLMQEPDADHLDWTTRMSIVCGFLVCLLISGAILGPPVLIAWKFAFWIFN